MHLERVKIRNYKCLRDIDVAFSAPDGARPPFSAQLLVGKNGSGKSCFLEALGLIFTRVMQGEVPGFPFALQYRIRQDRAQVRVQPAGRQGRQTAKLAVAITENGETRELDHVPEEYLPRRIVACNAGVNHLMDSVLLSSPLASLASDLYDLALQNAPGHDGQMSRLLAQYRLLDANPRIFSLDERTAKLVLPVLFAVIPRFQDPEAARSYFALRGELVRRIDEKLVPAAFSLTVDETRLQRFIEERQNSPQFGLLARLFRTEQPDGSGPLHSWMVRRPILSPPGEYSAAEDAARMSQTAVFRYAPWPGAERPEQMWSPELSREFDGDPMVLLNVLAAADRSGLLRDVQFAFHRGSQPALLGLETFSDGELMWLARMGLVLMSRLAKSAETLFLFDEPDVNFNSEWNVDFINTLRRHSRLDGDSLHHEFVITTHSTLLLTDAYAEQIHLFSAGPRGIQAERPAISTFAAQQDELARHLFSAKAVGRYAQEQVEALLRSARTPDDLLDLIQRTGPGYQRFRLYEQYFQMKKQR